MVIRTEERIERRVEWLVLFDGNNSAFFCPPTQVYVREPGSIGGQQFMVEECSDCDVYLLDNTAALTIDVCTDCRIFTGPCESR